MNDYLNLRKQLKLLLPAMICFASSVPVFAEVSYYVFPSGDDKNSGTLEAPFQTISKARDVVRRAKNTAIGDFNVYLRGGTYFLTSPVEFNVNDGGSNGHQVIYQADSGETPIISGAT